MARIDASTGKEGGPGQGVVAGRREQTNLKRKLEQEQQDDEERQELMRQLLEARNKEQAGVKKKSKDSAAAGEPSIGITIIIINTITQHTQPQ
jgi:hypothetical protein